MADLKQITVSSGGSSTTYDVKDATARSHATDANRLTTAKSEALYKIATTAEGHVKSVTAVQKSDITGLGIPAQDTTYTFDGTYNASTNKAATVSTVTNAINALDGNLNSTTPGAGKTLTAFSQTDGKVSATFGNISITKSQVSDFPSSMTPASHTHGNIQNGGTLQTNDVTIASGDKLVVTDSSDSNKVARTSVSFDGSTTTKALTQKGTFETFLQSHQDISGKVDIAQGSGNAGKVMAINSSGNIAAHAIADLFYPVGSIYMSVSSNSPATLFGGTWEQIKGKFLYGCEDEGEDYVAGASSGRKSVVLTDAELPSHSHTVPSHTHAYDKATSLAGNSGNTSGTAISVAQTTSHNHCQSIEAAINYTSSANTYGYIMHGSYDTRYGKSWSSSSGSGNTHAHTLNGHSHTVNYTSTASGGVTGLTTYSTGDGAGFSIMPPYLAVYVWKRTA